MIATCCIDEQRSEILWIAISWCVGQLAEVTAALVHTSTVYLVFKVHCRTICTNLVELTSIVLGCFALYVITVAITTLIRSIATGKTII